MKEQYDIERILMNTHNRFLMQPGYEDTRPYQYQIYVQIKGKEDRYYVIRADQDSHAKLWKISGQIPDNNFLEGELIEDPGILAIESAVLGSVYVKFDDQVVQEYEDFNDFWEDVGH